jgi:antitoxin YefM
MYKIRYKHEDAIMSDVSYTEFRQHLARYMDEVWDTRAPLRVTRQNARAVVVLSEEEYESMVETLHLLRSPANAERLLRSIRRAESGRLVEHELVEKSARRR